MHFQKHDLVANHYYWADENSHLFTGQPSRRTFDRFNGHQMLFVINFYGSISDQFSIGEGRQMEQRLLHELPDETVSEMAVFNWIRNTVTIN